MLQPLKPADRKTLLALMTQLVDLNNEARGCRCAPKTRSNISGKSG